MEFLHKASRYNHAIPHRGKILLFNGMSSGLVRLEHDLYDSLSSYLCGDRSFSIESCMTPHVRSTLRELLAARYIVDSATDEVAALKQRFYSCQQQHPVSATIAATMDCNLRCYYCFEPKGCQNLHLTRSTCDLIFNYLITSVEKRAQDRLYVAWTGGEPLLWQGAIEYLSDRLLDYCRARSIRYISYH